MDFRKLIENKDINNIKGVILAGAHHGQEYELFKSCGINKMLFIEPCNPAMNVLTSKFGTNEDVRLVNCALGEDNYDTEINVETFNNGMSNSILTPKKHLLQYPQIEFNTKEKISVKKLDDLEFTKEYYNMLYMDVQGFELNVLKGATETLKNIDYVFTEVNRDELYEGCAMVEQLDEFLSDFIRVETNWEGGTWGDAFYIRKKAYKKQLAVILFHADIHKIYKKEWINECLSSLQNQTIKNFKVYEFCYGHETIDRIWQHPSGDIRYGYYHSPMPNHVFAENSAIQIAYNDGFDYFFIVNLDDLYTPRRIEKQLEALNNGYDLISSDFIRFWEDDRQETFKMSKLNFGAESQKDHNIIAHPVVAFNRKFWETCRFFDVNAIPKEDFDMWKKAAIKNMKFFIVPEVLLYHRVHSQNVSR